GDKGPLVARGADNPLPAARQAGTREGLPLPATFMDGLLAPSSVVSDREKRVARRRRLHAQGLSDQEIARRAGEKIGTVRAWRRRDAYRRAKSDTEAAALLGMGAGTFREWRLRRGLPAKRSRAIGRAERERRIHLVRSGLSRQQVARRLGIKPGTLAAWMKDNGLVAPRKPGRPPLRQAGRVLSAVRRGGQDTRTIARMARVPVRHVQPLLKRLRDRGQLKGYTGSLSPIEPPAS